MFHFVVLAVLFSLLLLVLTLTLSLSLVSASQLKVTEEHPFLVYGKWIEASQLQIGDEIQTINGRQVRITNITDVEVPENESFLS